MNFWDIVLAALVAAVFVLAVGRCIRNRRAGGCGCGCGNCGGCARGGKAPRAAAPSLKEETRRESGEERA